MIKTITITFAIISTITQNIVFHVGYLRREDGKNWGCWRWTRTSKVQWGFFNLHIPSEMIIIKPLSYCCNFHFSSWNLPRYLIACFCSDCTWPNFSRLQILLVLKKWHLRFDDYYYAETASFNNIWLKYLLIPPKMTDCHWRYTTAYVKVWDKDTISRDDFIGRVKNYLKKRPS